MTSPPTQIKVECPECSTVYDDWTRGSVNLDLDPWAADGDYLRECSTATCPNCSHVVELDVLTVETQPDGEELWTFGSHAEGVGR